MSPVALGAVLETAPEGRIGVAVSGGGDSVALLLLMRDWAAERGREIAAVTVDHGLRAASAGEARDVAGLCAGLGISHDVLRWEEGPGRGNLQDLARSARRRLIGDWAAARGIGAVALGHTLEDQAETFLMRLARGSGVDGLSCMAEASRGDGVVWLRPLLGTERAALRAWLRARGVGWAEDPSNADPLFLRVRARAALGPLADLGLGPERLARTAAGLRRVRAALEAMTSDLASRCVTVGSGGDVTLDPAILRPAAEEIRLRLLAAALCFVAGARFRPRLRIVEAVDAALARGDLGRGLTAQGCVLRPVAGGGVAVRREVARVECRVPVRLGLWDNRWRVTDTGSGALEIGALGAAGLSARPRWRDAGVARETLLTTPALWRGEALVAALALDEGCAGRALRVSPLLPPWTGAEMR